MIPAYKAFVEISRNGLEIENDFANIDSVRSSMTNLCIIIQDDTSIKNIPPPLPLKPIMSINEAVLTSPKFLIPHVVDNKISDGTSPKVSRIDISALLKKSSMVVSDRNEGDKLRIPSTLPPDHSPRMSKRSSKRANE